MEAVLIEQWLNGARRAFEILDDASLALVREAIRALEAPQDVIDRAVLVASELGRNQLRHARRGGIAVHSVERGPHRGIEIVAADAGPGLRGLEAAFDAVPRSRGSLGVGIGAVRRMASEVDIDVRANEGTCIRARLFDPSAPRRREIGIFGRPLPGEAASGDHALFARGPSVLSLAVCDGLGHGPAARKAADVAMDTFTDHALEKPPAVLEECHRRVASTRGAVMAMVQVEEPGAGIELASVGNIEVLIAAPRSARRFGGTSAVIGGRPSAMKVRGESSTLGPDDVLVLVTDGITSRLSIETELALLRAHPAVIAEHVLARFAREHDDALVLVAR